MRRKRSLKEKIKEKIKNYVRKELIGNDFFANVKLNQRTKKHLRNLLFDEEYFMAADIGFREHEIIIVKKDNVTNEISLIGHYNNSDYDYKKLWQEVDKATKMYYINKHNMTIDEPRGMNFQTNFKR